MLITLIDLEREPVSFAESIPPGAIDFSPEAIQIGPLAVEGRAEVLHEHRGPKEIIADIRARAQWKGDFDLLFRPLGADAGPADRSLAAPDTEIGYYQEEGLVLEDVLREQVLLSLPARSLCRPDCQGLCPRCGRNLNTEPCTCEDTPSDPRWTALSELRSRLSTGNGS